MAVEIERKFLVVDQNCVAGAAGTVYRQGYIYSGPPVSVRVRVAGDKAYLTVKQNRGDFTRSEFEYPIPVADAEEMMRTMCGDRIVEKTRYRVAVEGSDWEVDVFHGANAGLVVAEIELKRVDEEFARPPWLGEEVTRDRRYLNSWLAEHPYGSWV